MVNKNFFTQFFCLLIVYLSAANQIAFGQSNISWHFKTSGKIQATPIVSDDVLYIGSFDGCFYALDAKTGTEKWHYKTGNQIYSTPVKYNNTLCFESGNILYSLNLQGELQWKFTMYEGTFQNQHDEWDYYHSSPLLVDSIIYIGSEKGLVFGVNAKTGEKTFECQTPSANYTIETTPAVYDNKIYFGDWDGVFFAYDLTGDTLVWSYDTKRDNIYSGWVNAIVTDPVIVGEEVFFGGRSCNHYCLNAKTGIKKWHVHDPNGDMWTLGGPTIEDGVIYYGSSLQNEVRAFNMSNGSVKWRCNVGNRVNGKPLIDSDYVIVGTEHISDAKSGSLVFVTKSDGRVVSKLDFGQIYSTPVLNDSLIYFGCVDSSVYAVKYSSMIYVPKLNINCGPLMQLGNRYATSTFDTSFCIYNRGKISDSVSVTTASTTVTIMPTNFLLAVNDSQQVTITVDPASLNPQTYNYVIKVKSNKSLPPVEQSLTVRFTIQNTTDVSIDKGQKPESYLLEQNYPNPFNPETMISYQLPVTGNVELKIFDALGREISTLVNKEQDAGIYEVRLEGVNLSSGIYFYRIKAGDFVQTKKMLLMR